MKRPEKPIATRAATALSDRDRDLFLKLLMNPPEPNAALRSAAETYRSHVAVDIGGSSSRND